ncbi:exonuclease 1-like [Saccoglossus kowalevskii]
MGIQGLLPLMKDATEPANISKYAGYTVAVDTYCWLHKGAFACAMQLAKGEKTDQYVRYVLKFVNMLLSMNVKPILVFDGCNLPSKESVEKSRRERRQTYLAKGKQFLREGKVSEARDCFTKCVNVTSKMALDVMQAARSLGVDCIVAPYEADAQLAYLNRVGIAQCVITEDSDLVAFGCDKVMVKMDLNGNGLEIDKSKLNKIMKMGSKYSFDKFRYMCIASGCDYLASLPNIGLKKACKIFQLATNPDLTHVLKRFGHYLKSNIVVPPEYIQGFIQANNTFLHQIVFDPIKRKSLPLTPYPDDIDPKEMQYAGKFVDDNKALQLALGNINIQSMQIQDDYKPDFHKPIKKNTPRYLLSIWHKDYRPLSNGNSSEIKHNKERLSTVGKDITTKTPIWKQTKTIKIKKLPFQTGTSRRWHKRRVCKDNTLDEPDNYMEELKSQYSGTPIESKPQIKVSNVPVIPVSKPPPSPTKNGKIRNKFAVFNRRMSSERRENLLRSSNTEMSRFFVNNLCTKSPEATVIEKKEKTFLNALVDNEKDSTLQSDVTMGEDEEEMEAETSSCCVTNEDDQAVNSSLNKFIFTKGENNLKHHETQVGVINNYVTNNIVKHNKLADDEEDVAMTTNTYLANDEKAKKNDEEKLSTSKSLLSRLSSFKWNKGEKKSGYFSKMPFKNSREADGQFKQVKRASQEYNADDDLICLPQLIVPDADLHVTHLQNDSGINMSGSINSTEDSEEEKLSLNCSLRSGESLGGEKYSDIINLDVEELMCSQGSLPSSQSSFSGVSMNVLKGKIQGVKNPVGKCRIPGIRKTSGVKRKSSYENMENDKQPKITVFQVKQIGVKTKKKKPMSPAKDNVSDVIN